MTTDFVPDRKPGVMPETTGNWQSDLYDELHDRIDNIKAEIEEDADRRLGLFVLEHVAEKLKASRAKGRSGWWDENRCTIEYLESLLESHLKKGNPGNWIDIIVLIAMIACRGKTSMYLEATSRQPYRRGDDD